MKKIVWQRVADEVLTVTPGNTIVYPVGSLIVTTAAGVPASGESEAMFLDGVALRALNADPRLATCIRLPNVEPASLPSRRFRNHWRLIGGQISPAVPLCRVERLKEIRAERDVRLDKSDRVKARLDDVGTAAQIAAYRVYRQALRDLPATVQADLSTLTPDQAEAYQPLWPQEP